jgi:predicted enzyme related to lactoylglutathione lyase
MTAANFTAPSLNFVLFYVADLDASAEYFANTLGFTLDAGQSVPNFRQFNAGPGGATIGLLQAADQTPPPGEVELYLGTPDLAALREAWTARGAAATPIVQMPFGKIFEVKTPDGRKLTPFG